MGNFFLHDLEPKEKVEYEQRITRVLDAIIGLYLGASERAIKSLALVNGGGIITMLSYIHTLLFFNKYVVLSLIAFILGFILFLLLVLLDFKISLSQLERLASQVSQFYENKISFNKVEIFSQKYKSSWKNRIPTILGYSSLFLSFLGIFWGLLGFYIEYVVNSSFSI